MENRTGISEFLPLDDFLAYRKPGGDIKIASPDSKKWQIFGCPLHLSAEDLKSRFDSNSIDDFLRLEARHAVGNYVICALSRGVLRVIASPGYSGGYLYCEDGALSVGSMLSPVLGCMPTAPRMDAFGACLFLSHAPKSNFNQLPLRSMFSDVSRLPPGSYLEVRASGKAQFRNYLCDPDRLEPPLTFYRAMNETMVSVAGFYERNPGMKAALMFSGGVDSLAIYLGLREVLGAENIALYTMEHSASNGPERAFPAAEALKANLEFVSNDVFADGTIFEKIRENMTMDLPAYGAPHVALMNRDMSDTILFHGQNFDALANIHMEVLQETHEVGYLTAAGKRIAYTETRDARQKSAFLKNLQLTDSYLEDDRFQALSLDFYLEQRPGLIADPEPGRRGVLRGFLSSQYPNLLSRSKYPMDQVSSLNREIAIFDEYIGQAASGDIRMSVDMMRYLTYTQLANKRIAGFEIGPNTRPMFLAMSGPLTSYYLGRPRNLAEASQPKREIYAYARQLAGIPYRKLIVAKKKSKHRSSVTSEDRVNMMLHASYDTLDLQNSAVIDAVDNSAAKKYLRKLYDSTTKACAPGSDDFNSVGGSMFQRQLALKFINLEKIIRAAQTYRDTHYT
ncbi:MAG: hypothetical protein EP318_00210 [Rhodobacteraceae bacterium]|nr:MAG: hypothetical protein EP318_00210 [Paracoccaceae bacterium]